MISPVYNSYNDDQNEVFYPNHAHLKYLVKWVFDNSDVYGQM